MKTNSHRLLLISSLLLFLVWSINIISDKNSTYIYIVLPFLLMGLVSTVIVYFRKNKN